MISLFLLGELTSERFGDGIQTALDAAGQTERLLTAADLGDAGQNCARRAILAMTRGYGENRDVFQNFPARVRWVRAMLAPRELARVRYIEYSYWNKLSCGSRLPSDAAQQIRRGVRVFGVSNGRFLRAARAVERGELFPPLILAGRRRDRLICLEGHLRLTAYALARFPREVECLVGTARTMDRWDRWRRSASSEPQLHHHATGRRKCETPDRGPVSSKILYPDACPEIESSQDQGN